MILYIIKIQNKKNNFMNYFFTYRILIFITLLCILFSGDSVADKLITAEKNYQDVYIMEGIHSLYILFPETGAIESVLKKDINNGTLTFDEPEKRMNLKKKWDEKQSISMKSSEVKKTVSNNEINETYPINSVKKSSEFVLKRKGSASQNYLSDNYYFNRHNIIPTLPGTPYQSNISPRIMENKTYGFYNPRNTDSLPKIVLRNPSVSGGGFPSRVGMVNYGMNPFSGGGMGRIPTGYGFGMGMFNDVTVISNISDLFSTIDDHLVGEFGPIKIIHSTIKVNNNQR